MIEPPVIGYEATEVHSSSRTRANHLFTGTLVVLILALFMSFIFNRYLPINEGWYYYYAWLMHKGQMPYRDFWYISQPFDLFVAYVFAGDHLINLRIFGLVERIVLSGLLYFLLSRKFSPKACFLATLLAIVMLLTYLTEGFFTFLIDSLTFLLAGLICVYESQIHPQRDRWWLLLAGIVGSLCFFSKQSTGLFGTLALAVLIAWPALEDLRQVIPKLVYFSIGWCIPAVPIVMWLVRNDALQAYLREVFKGAASSKGSLETVLFTTFTRNFQPKMLVIDILLVAAFSWAVWKKHIVFRRPQIVSSSKIDIALTSAIALILLFVPIFIRIISDPVVVRLRQYLAVAAKAIFMAMLLLFLWLLFRRLKMRREASDSVTAILLIGGFFWAYACLMSNKVEQHAIVLGVAYIVAAACDNLASRTGKSFIGIITVVCLLQVGELAVYKYNDAYDWNGWRSVIPVHTVRSHWPQLAGFEVDEPTVHIIDTILDDVAQGSKPGEPIFTFPHTPMFNFITGRPQPTFAPVHYWDVAPDDLAIADAARVKAARPAVIVDMDMPEWLWGDAELTFRKGQKSGQRQIEAVIKEFAASGDYRLKDTFVTPWVFTRVNVWQRVR